MFSANENLQLRHYKKAIVAHVEECIPESVLDLGVNVMVMQVSCKAPGCVPLETAIVIVFPASATELLPGLPESKGGNYKTKILKPMSVVTKEDVLEALPPQFPGGLRSIEKLCLRARDIMLAQITQLFGDEDEEGRRLMAHYLQTSLQQYLDRNCTPPEIGEPFPPTIVPTPSDSTTASTTTSPVATLPTAVITNGHPLGGTKNIVIRRILDEDQQDTTKIQQQLPQPSVGGETSATPSAAPIKPPASSSNVLPSMVDSVVQRRKQQAAEHAINQQLAYGGSDSSNNNLLARLAQREHAPGVRQRGCPCCDPDDPSNIVDHLLQY